MAVVGASGSGKSLLAYALLGILPENATITGEMRFQGERLTPERCRSLRGRAIALIPQSVAYLDPLMTVGRQVQRVAQLAGRSKPQVRADVEGSVSVNGRSLPKKGYCPVQLIFQNPELSMNPRWRIHQILQEGYPTDPTQLEAFGIHPGWLNRYPHELSGGELQRVAIARILNPATRYLIADEMTAMLDANTQALTWQIVLKFVRQQQVGLSAKIPNLS